MKRRNSDLCLECTTQIIKPMAKDLSTLCLHDVSEGFKKSIYNCSLDIADGRSDFCCHFEGKNPTPILSFRTTAQMNVNDSTTWQMA